MVFTGVYYAIGLIAGGIVASVLTRPAAGVPFYILAAFCLYFFRDPGRTIPEGPVAVSPADGKVVELAPEGEDRQRVSIFLNVFDVHVNRTPIAGTITKVEYKPGKFLVASVPEASTQNEMNVITVEDGDTTVVFKQIAGLIARRVVCDKKPGDKVEKGERIGLIKFGSRMDIIFGPEWEIGVREGQRVSAGSSILATRKDTPE